METQIQTAYKGKPITVFGYATKSVPGLEINGLGKYGRGIKEKIIFVTRCRNLRIPLKRFVLNVEMPDCEDISPEETRNIEYALLLQYWHLAGLLPIANTERVLAVGSFSPSGVITLGPEELRNSLCKEYDLVQVDGNDLTSSIGSLEFRQE